MNGFFRRIAANPVNYWLGYCCDIGGSLAIIGAGFATSERGLEASVLALLSGLVAYTWYEYVFHRWIYHGPPSPLDHVHTFHHELPRAVIGAPFFFTLSMCGLTWAAASMVLDRPTAAIFAGSVLLGYAYQSVVHNWFHNRRFAPDSLLGQLRRHHLIHHRDGSSNFGVITSFWDRLLGTSRQR